MHIFQLLAAVMLLAISATAVHAQGTSSVYLQGDIGGDYYPENEQDGRGFDLGPGVSLGGRIGTPLSFLRGELEGGLAIANIDLENDAGDEDATYYQLSLAAGAYADLGPIYVGGGAGLVYQEVEAEVLGITISDSDTNFVAFGEAGIAINITDTVQLVPHYRVTWLPGFDLDDEVIVHSARLGVRFEP